MFILSKRQGILTVILSLCFLSHAHAQKDPSDPLESFNRGTFAFNDKVDQLITKPIATLYNKIMPKPLNIGIHNVYSNLNQVPTIVNDILQFKFYQTANDTWRFFVNSTIGVGGLFDVGTRIGLPHYINDFGLTLANYGWTHSTYIVLPLFGPSTIRDTIEIPVDYYAFSIYPYIEPTRLEWGVYLLGVVDRRAQLLKLENVLNEAIFDRYTFVRDAYLQRRTYQIEDSKHHSALDAYRARHGLQAAAPQEEFKPIPETIVPKIDGVISPAAIPARPNR